MKRPAISLMILFLVASASPMFNPAPAAAATVSVSSFHSSLQPYGRWTARAEYGEVWRPTHVASSWRPYSNGRWVYTSAGWAFDSYEPWAWATYHYGRWAYDPTLGWVWVPGTEWAPAWVDFQFGDGWIGWAPLPPSFVVGVAFRTRIEPSRYCFVDQRRFLDPWVGRYALSSRRNADLLRSARDVTRVSRASGRVVVSGPPVERIERAVRRPITRRPIVEVTNTRQASTRRAGAFVAVRPPAVARPTPTGVHHMTTLVHRTPTVVRRTPTAVRRLPAVVSHASPTGPAHGTRTMTAHGARGATQGHTSMTRPHARPKSHRPPS